MLLKPYKYSEEEQASAAHLQTQTQRTRWDIVGSCHCILYSLSEKVYLQLYTHTQTYKKQGPFRPPWPQMFERILSEVFLREKGAHAWSDSQTVRQSDSNLVEPC